MDEGANGNGKGKRPDGELRVDTTPALASIRYNSITAADNGTSSEDEAAEALQIPVEDAQTAIGFSIGDEQKRLTSPKTPAIEKQAALEQAGGFFGVIDGVQDTVVEEPEEEDQQEKDEVEAEREAPFRPEIPQPSARQTPVRAPSPWKADSKARWQTGGKSRSGLFDGIFNRRRASSGPEAVSSDSWQKSIMSSLPSVSNPFSSAGASFSSSDVRDARGITSSTTESTSAPDKLDDSTSSRRTSTRAAVESPSTTLRTTTSGAEGDLLLSPLRSGPRQRVIRRSTSDHSLTTLRTLSTAESLGDDSRFEGVNEQVNSRLKAIKDSWQDANFKLPSLPSLSTFTPEFLRERSGAHGKRQSLGMPSNTDSANTAHHPASYAAYARQADPMKRRPYASANAAVSDATAGKGVSHPHFARALQQARGDIVVLGGYRGSILRSAQPPHRQLWVPVKVGLNLRKVNLEVGLEEGDDERATETVIPGGMLTHIGPIDIARRLLKRLRECDNAKAGQLRVHDYGYDWRLDPTHLSNGLIKFLESLPCNKPGTPKEDRGATVIAHSLGGLITRHAINKRPELFRGVVYAGVPYTCVNILGPMRNGDEVLLSDRVLTAQVNFSIRTSYALLPLDGRCFFDKKTREEYHVDFFDPQTWLEYRLSPCIARPLPPLVPPPKPGGISGYVSSMASVLPSLPDRVRRPSLRSKNPTEGGESTVAGAAEPEMSSSGAADSSKVLANGNIDGAEQNQSNSPRTAVTIPKDKAMEYLTRTLASVKKFKQELAFIPAHADANLYPPVAVIYGKSTPTVYGAKVDGREGIKHADAYDELAFASGDGVVLARAAQVPVGYTTSRGGVVSSERGHVTLLSDLEAVGRCLNAIIRARAEKRVGQGL